MNDFDYDALQKKRIASGAFHMKRGSRSKRCSLPSDNLTPAQLKRRNGPVSTYKLDQPMSWDDFLGMPEDLQRKYLLGLIESYRATNEMLGDMFHIHSSAVCRVRKHLGIPGMQEKLTKDERMTRIKIWTAFCNGVVGGGDAAPETPREPEKVETLPVILDPLEENYAPVEPEPEPEPGTAPETEAKEEQTERKYLELHEVSAVFAGPFSLESFASWMHELPVPYQVDVRISVRVEKL